MPGLVQRRFEAAEGLLYDASRDVVYLRGGYRGVRPIVGVRSILMDFDVVHINDLMVRDEIVVRGGSIIKGNILAEGRVVVEIEDSPTVIAGDVGVLATDGGGELIVREGQPLVVLGNVMAKSVEIRAPTIILGNIVAQSRAKLGARSLIMGRVIVGSKDSPGSLELEQATAYHCHAIGSIHLSKGVSIVVPLVSAQGGKIKVESRVRVLSFPCLFCGETEEPLVCEYYIEGRCPLEEKGAGYDYLYTFDLAKAKEYEYLSWFWRASPLMVLQNVLAKKLLLLSWQMTHSVSVDIERKTINGMKLEDVPRSLSRIVIKALRGEAKGSLEEVKGVLFATIEEYFKARGERYLKCPGCGMPNPIGERICVYCSYTLG